MKVNFELNHKVLFGQSVYVCGTTPELGGGDEEKAIAMICIGDAHWSLETTLKPTEQIEYCYLIKENNRTVAKEWSTHKTTFGKADCVVLHDFWQDAPLQRFLYTSAFTDGFFAHPVTKTLKTYKNTILLSVNCPFVDRNQSLVLCGEADFMGNWDEAKALHFDYFGNGQWTLALPASKIKTPIQYKLAIFDKQKECVIHWEETNNRELYPINADKNIETTEVLHINYAYHWFSWKAAGMAIPVFSLRTKKSAGVGDFADIKTLVDWVAETGQKIIQILPVNDTTTTHTWTDSYPYSAISIYALHPLYFALSECPLKNKALQQEFSEKAKALNSLEAIDYEAVISMKNAYIKALFNETGKEVAASNGFKQFFKANEYWLFPYACFSVLRDKNGTANYSEWKQYQTYDKKSLEKLIATEKSTKETVERIYFTQYLLHTQLLSAAEYAHGKGVILKGDIPIGISRNSVEAWTEPHLFNLDVQTGAPPDDFSVSGQNWLFPTYNWDAMVKEGYRWWINRFRKMADYFDAYRIDHILGFFRIWEIPAHSVQGLLGYFTPALPFSVDEIQHGGLYFDEYRMTNPYIHDCFLHEIFGDYKEEVIGDYLQSIAWQRFELKEFCNTQQKIKALFDGKTDEKSACLRDGLYALCNEVLFVRDKKEPHKFHPRISAQFTYSYQSLDEKDKAAFNRLYDHFFYHRHNDFWYAQAMQKLLPLVSSTQMLVCGEDLGMIPDCVASVMSELQILSLEIQRMPKETNRLFGDLNALPYMSVCTTSTHDMTPIRAWWTENKANTQRYYNEMLWKDGVAPDDCTTELCEQILCNHLNSPAMLTVIPLQDWLSISGKLRRANPDEERINIPAFSQHYWRYRMHISLENLLEEKDFNAEIRELVKETGR